MLRCMPVRGLIDVPQVPWDHASVELSGCLHNSRSILIEVFLVAKLLGV